MDYFAPMARLPGRWAGNVRIGVDGSGRIREVQENAGARGAEVLRGCVVPGMNNLHSHAFQRAMRGLTQWRAGREDDFWSWREAMYACAARISPEDQHAIAAQVFMEMLQSGYTGVVEFHYLHRTPDGAAGMAMAEAVIRAARDTGIRLCLLPVLYMHGGFGARPARPEQQRFIHSLDSYTAMVRELSRDASLKLGVALHSLRAVPPEAIPALESLATELGAGTPIHVHVAEQQKEVEECLQWCGERPVRWLLDHAAVDQRWCLVHATHVDDDEVADMAARGCTAGLCPTTEADLGDGIFPASRFLDAGGRFGVGSDSQATVDPFSELRLLEYGQRLAQRRRNLAAGAGEPHTGTRLWEAAVSGGAQAAGIDVAGLQPGAFADFLVFDADSVNTPGMPATLLDSLVFGNGHPMPAEVLVGGRRLVRNGEHRVEDEIGRRYREAINRLQLEDLLPGRKTGH